jgi:hypothetical protein
MLTHHQVEILSAVPESPQLKVVFKLWCKLECRELHWPSRSTRWLRHTHVPEVEVGRNDATTIIEKRDTCQECILNANNTTHSRFCLPNIHFASQKF